LDRNDTGRTVTGIDAEAQGLRQIDIVDNKGL